MENINRLFIAYESFHLFAYQCGLISYWWRSQVRVVFTGKLTGRYFNVHLYVFFGLKRCTMRKQVRKISWGWIMEQVNGFLFFYLQQIFLSSKKVLILTFFAANSERREIFALLPNPLVKKVWAKVIKNESWRTIWFVVEWDHKKYRLNKLNLSENIFGRIIGFMEMRLKNVYCLTE